MVFLFLHLTMTFLFFWGWDVLRIIILKLIGLPHLHLEEFILIILVINFAQNLVIFDGVIGLLDGVNQAKPILQ